MKLLFSFFAAQMWNKLPSELRQDTKLSTFQFKLNTHLFCTNAIVYILCLDYCVIVLILCAFGQLYVLYM